jgi:hypothetical protein
MPLQRPHLASSLLLRAKRGKEREGPGASEKQDVSVDGEERRRGGTTPVISALPGLAGKKKGPCRARQRS